MGSSPRPNLNDERDSDSSTDNEVGPNTHAQNGTPTGDGTTSTTAAKKRKKRKTPAQKKAAAAAREQEQQHDKAASAPHVLKISRNKHMKYISSYHGPWLQLPHEVLDTLLTVNCDESALPTVRGLVEPPSSTPTMDRARFHAIAAGPHERRRSPSPSPIPQMNRGGEKAAGNSHLPSPIDPAVFRGVSQIRKLVDDASDLAVRAAVGMSAAALGSFGSGGGAPPLSACPEGGGRNAGMSAVRQHRLRALAVSKLAEAYRIDEIAAAVAVMQGATGLDDLAQRVLKQEPDHLDALYVHFHHEKIPSRTLASSTDTTQLDHLIACDPHRLEYYRTRGVVHGFKQDYVSAVRNFTQALTEAKAIRKEKEHRAEVQVGGGNLKKKKGGKNGKMGGKKGKTSPAPTGDGNEADMAPILGPNGNAAATAPTSDPSSTVGKEPGDDLERQMYFHRAMAHFHHACRLMEDAALDVEGVQKPKGGLSNEGGELTLRNVGIVLADEIGGLYGNASPEKQARYRVGMGEPSLRERVMTLLRKSVRDHERFLAYFKVWEAPPGNALEEEDRQRPTLGAKQTDRPLTFRGRRLIHHRALAQRTRDADPRRLERQRRHQDAPMPAPTLLTTYHPLIIESHFTVLLIHLLLGDFKTLVQAHARTVRLMDHLEGYPVFLPARSLTMSEYAEVLERLSATWRIARESSGIAAPDLDVTEVELARGEDELACLHQVCGFFSTEFVEALVRQAERERQAFVAKKEGAVGERRKLLGLENGLGMGKAKEITYGEEEEEEEAKGQGNTTGSWKEERDKADAERRKIDPSYSFHADRIPCSPDATYNTARAEVALAWLQAVILPEKEAEQLAKTHVQFPNPTTSHHDDAHTPLGATNSIGKGKGKGKGKAVSAASSSYASASAFTQQHEAFFGSGSGSFSNSSFFAGSGSGSTSGLTMAEAAEAGGIEDGGGVVVEEEGVGSGSVLEDLGEEE
ncbi:BZ3500_MvSof-1268-A1-R1_Chr3-1g06022 [Microbotryum saponariae]|uniref:BZ3500_MvSof-1268-A1-R1_Chr3-1g06022 protein n=1 Tax=Microbotryum saponariae TaxID=289078 RepID=A0A2X0NCC0_9BASI|nr:BZ3500_MvSof-1268-A1-R1_Chr3-1g06022 [Microbotryum saponariae]SDA05212.1 BZ3501_MvSof-1269-A2-R1_Chr3-1g05692 [Microbotryum saponariae]